MDSFIQQVLNSPKGSDQWEKFREDMRKGKLLVGGSTPAKKRWTCVGKSANGWPIMQSDDGRQIELVGQNYNVGFSQYANY